MPVHLSPDLQNEKQPLASLLSCQEEQGEDVSTWLCWGGGGDNRARLTISNVVRGQNQGPNF